MVDGFASKGWTVVGCGQSREVIEILGSEHRAPHLFRAVDVGDADGVEAFAAEVVCAVGAPDLVLNNAALINANAPLWEVPVDEFSRVIDVNLKGVYHVVRVFVPRMVERGSGVVVNFSSGWGRSVSPDVAPYCCTKWGVEGLTAALAQELPSGMAAVTLNPGVINTDMLQSCFGGGAYAYLGAREWALTAVPFLAGLGAGDNGGVLTAP